MNRLFSFQIFFVLIAVSCSNGERSRYSLLDSSFDFSDPLVNIDKVASFKEITDSFYTPIDNKFRLFAAGELLYNLSDGPRSQLFKNDDITLVFRNKSGIQNHKFIPFDCKDLDNTVKTNLNNISYIGWQYSDSSAKYYTRELVGKYYCKFKIPWSVVGLNKAIGSFFDMDIRIGDADDEFIQKTVISVNCNSNLKDSTYQLGHYQLATEAVSYKQTIITPGSTRLDTVIGYEWSKAKAFPIYNVIHGSIKDKYDLLATVKFLWDKEALYILLDIQDNERYKKKEAVQTFADQAWIEDSSHKKIWETDARFSKHSGGAFKNQYIDTVLALKKGRYYVHYHTDESHAYNDWDDEMPIIPLYGILVCQVK